MIRNALGAFVLLLGAAGAAKADPYVACDNRLRCVRAPCPSTNLLNLRTGKVGRVAGVDLSKLSAKERGRVDRADAAYYGSLALEGVVADRPIAKGPRGAPNTLLVVSRVGRKTTAEEQRLCRAGAR